MAKRTVTMLLEKWQSNNLSPVDDDLTRGIVLELNHRAIERQLIDIMFMFPRCGLPAQWEGNPGRAANVKPIFKKSPSPKNRKKSAECPE